MDAARTYSQPELNRILAAHERRGLGPSRVRSDLKNAKLDGLNLANRDLAGLDLSGASLVGATICGSNLTKVRLFGADLRRSDLRNTNLAGADLRGATLNHANLCFAKLDNADLNSVAMMKAGPDGMWVLDRADRFDGGCADAVGVDFTNCSLKGASFSYAELDGANFTGALLQGAIFKGAKLIRPVFKGAVLSGVNIEDLGVPADLLADCVFDVQQKALDRMPAIQAALQSHEAWVDTGGKQGAPAILDGEDLRPLRDAFAGRRLTAVSLSGAVAIGVDFSDCALQGAKFDRADLRDAKFSGSDLAGGSFRDAKLAHAVFHGAKISRLALLSGQTVTPDFSGADISSEQLHSAAIDDTAAARSAFN